MVTLMRFSTGEDWHLFMYELANQEGYHGKECIENQSFEDVQKNGIRGCGNWITVYAFFITFRIVICMLTLNLSVAAVIEGLDLAKKENLGEVIGDDIEGLIDLWMSYDPQATGWITMRDLIFLLHQLKPPLGKQYDEEEESIEKDLQNSGKE